MPAGRPTVMTKDVLDKLEEVFALGGTDEEACLFADISKQTLYDYQKLHTEFVDRKEALKETPILLARRTAIAKLSDSYVNAMDFLSRKRKKEFSIRTEITGEDGKELIPTVEIDKKAEEAVKKFLGK